MRAPVTYFTAMTLAFGLVMVLTPPSLLAEGQSQKDQRVSTPVPVITMAQNPELPAAAKESVQESERTLPEKAASEAKAYVPPHRGAPSPNRRLGGGTRGGNAAPPAILALAPPDQNALTLQEQPVLYWYASSPIATSVELSLTDENGIAPDLEVKLDPPIRAGIHPIRLADYGKRLSVGKRYRWSVALVFDSEHRSKDILTYGWIQRVEKGAPTTDSAKIGLWYDAVMAISAQIDAAPTDRNLRRKRAELFEMAELTSVAAYDKELAR